MVASDNDSFLELSTYSSCHYEEVRWGNLTFDITNLDERPIYNVESTSAAGHVSFPPSPARRNIP